jgi:hypothetical protein
MDENELPVILKAYNLVLEITRRTRKFPRDTKFILGDRILNTTYDMFEALLAAKYSRDKREWLHKANLLIERMRFQVRICYDEKLVSQSQYAFLSRLLHETGSMTGGWLKSIPA